MCVSFCFRPQCLRIFSNALWPRRSVRMRFILIHLLWHTVHFDGMILCEFCYCRTVLFCSVTVVRTFQLCGHRKADISSWLFYHSLWTILWYVFKIFMKSFILSIRLFSDFRRSLWAALCCTCQTGILSMDYFIEKYFADHSEVFLVCALITSFN